MTAFPTVWCLERLRCAAPAPGAGAGAGGAAQHSLLANWDGPFLSLAICHRETLARRLEQATDLAGSRRSPAWLMVRKKSQG